MIILVNLMSASTPIALVPGLNDIQKFAPLVAPDFTESSKAFQCYQIQYINGTNQVIHFRRGQASYQIDGNVSKILRDNTITNCDLDSIGSFPNIQTSYFSENTVLIGHGDAPELYHSTDLYKCKIGKTETYNQNDFKEIEFGYNSTYLAYTAGIFADYVYIYNNTCIRYNFINLDQSQPFTAIPIGAYRYPSAITHPGLINNYSHLCIGTTEKDCVMYHTPFDLTTTTQHFVYHAKSVVQGINATYTDIDIYVDETESPSTINIIENKCVRFIASTNRNITFQIAQPLVIQEPFIKNFDLSLNKQLEQSVNSKYGSGYCCFDRLEYIPVIMLTPKDPQMKKECSNWVQNPSTDYIYNYIYNTCTNLIFLGAYTKVITQIFCVLCIVFNIAWIVKDKDYRIWESKQVKISFILKTVTGSLGALALLIISVSNGTTFLCIFPCVLWIYTIVRQALKSTQFAEEEENDLPNMYQYVFKCSSDKAKTVIQLFCVWLVILILSIVGAILLIADITQFLTFLKIDTSFMEGSMLLAPSQFLTDIADKLIAKSPASVYIGPLVAFFISLMIQTFLRSYYCYNLVDKERIRRIKRNCEITKKIKEQKRAKKEKFVEIDDENDEQFGGIDWRGFVVRNILNVYLLFQNWVNLFTGEAIMEIYFTNENHGPSKYTVFIMFFVGSYYFTLCKYNCLIDFLCGAFTLIFQVLLNFGIVFIRLGQIFVNTILFIVLAPFYAILDISGISFNQFALSIPINTVVGPRNAFLNQEEE
ncbi:Hypothetical_protein [Hexamita inflata]|uniref:Hypothetical_protein n=1 Tax=Hexamita inflata TaxID=28002 RepID=A0AA86U3K1_9EUKA|nr:Hypothetical protein HINF_LOCUS26116 [Hexamita inflata]